MLLGCSKRVKYIESEKALLPVMIKGNKVSHNYLIVIAGGPAGDGIMYHYVFPFFKKLEKNYKVVYYDQRGSGNAKGEPNVNTFTIAQHAKDVSKVISSIKNDNSEAKVYLIGYSYGGSIALQFLSDESLSKQVEGAAMISGAFDRKLQAQYQQKLTIEFLQDWVNEGYINSYDYLTTQFICPPSSPSCQQDSIETIKSLSPSLKPLESLCIRK